MKREDVKQLLKKLSDSLSPGAMTFEPEDCAHYGRDWTTAFTPRASAVVFPRNTAEVSSILKFCSKHHIPVVPSGGRTGLSGGAVALNFELILNLSKMNQIADVDLIASTVRVQAGVTTQAVHEATSSLGLTWPIDLAAKGSSQIGGNIATNAGGIRVIRYGNTRSWVQSLEVVLMSGSILELNGDLEKNNAGYDLRQLIIGSEGTLAVVTQATLKLTRIPEQVHTLLFSLKSIGHVLQLLKLARKQPFTLLAFECLQQRCLDVVCEMRHLAQPFGQIADYYVVMDIEGEEGIDHFLNQAMDSEVVVDGTLGRDPESSRRIWVYREGISESLSGKGIVYKNDISIPISKLDAFITELEAKQKEIYGANRVYIFGHVGDGNLHINIMKDEDLSQEIFLERCEKASEKLFSLIQKHGGSISAEHGIGLLKKKYLHFTKSPAEIELFKKIKTVFDPQNLLNPGKIFD